MVWPGMPEGEVIHYYNVITGTVTCGAQSLPETERTVFLEQVTCPKCLKVRLKPEDNSKKKV
jgi:hypothetical protein